jgi:collagen type VII alpha
MSTQRLASWAGCLAIAAATTLLACGGDDNSGGSGSTGTTGTTGTTGGTGSTGTTGGTGATGSTGSTGGTGSTGATGGTGTTGGTGATGTTGTTGTTGVAGSSGTSGTATDAGHDGSVTDGGGGDATVGDSGSTTDAGAADAGPPTFTNVWSSIISTHCSTCHSGTGAGLAEGMLDMSTQAMAYTDLVGADGGMGVAAAGTGCGTSGLKRVTPGDAMTSLIYEKVVAKTDDAGAPCGVPMPAAGPALTAEQDGLIAAWINAGALNN